MQTPSKHCALAAPRNAHTATLLPSGKVLVAGGINAGIALASATLYDPATGAWTATGSFATARYFHTATLLPNGTVLVAGGNGGSALASTELYDPATASWSATGNLATARDTHTTTLLPNGQVLVVGGSSGSTRFASAELYDPAGNGGVGSWTATSPLATARSQATATLLPNGKVLVAGGLTTGNAILASAELYDPAAGTWSASNPLATARSHATATLLPNGKVLLAGGVNNTNYLVSTEHYNPVTGLWSATGSLGIARSNHTATLLPNGKVLLVGGGNSTTVLDSAELYDPATGTWNATSFLDTQRSGHTATLLRSGKVLVAAGFSGGFSSELASTELYDVGLGSSGSWQPQISAASFNVAGKLVLTGTGFRGISSASGGNGAQDSPTNYPVVQLRRLDNEQSAFHLSDPAATFSATAFTSVPVPLFSGYAMVTVFTNGIPSPAFLVGNPDIAVEQPAGSLVADGGTRNFVTVPGTAASLVFTIKNPSGADLTGLTIIKNGPNAANFTVTANPTAPVPPNGSTTFTVQFAPRRMERIPPPSPSPTTSMGRIHTTST